LKPIRLFALNDSARIGYKSELALELLLCTENALPTTFSQQESSTRGVT